jgi:hypothetical protein
MQAKEADQYEPTEARDRFEATLRGALKAPPQHKEAPKPKKDKASQKQDGEATPKLKRERSRATESAGNQ